MPSPLCEKEIDQVFPIFSSDDEDVDESDPNVSIYSVSLKDDLTLDMSKFVRIWFEILLVVRNRKVIW